MCIRDRYYVAQFIKRTNDADATSQSISSTLSNQKAGEYVKALTEKYEVTDVAGKLAYLTIEESTTEAVETGTEAAKMCIRDRGKALQPSWENGNRICLRGRRLRRYSLPSRR